MLLKISNLIILFFIFAFIGWILESVTKTISGKKWINSGFLSGPICPVYGFGGILVFILIQFFNQNTNIIWLNNPGTKFIAFMVVTTILEYFTGYALEKIYNDKWWDYSNDFLNLHGRICLKCSIYWGVLSYGVSYVFDKIDFNTLLEMHLITKYIIASILLLYILTDFAKASYDVISFSKVKKKIKDINKANIKYINRIKKAFPQINIPEHITEFMSINPIKEKLKKKKDKGE